MIDPVMQKTAALVVTGSKELVPQAEPPPAWNTIVQTHNHRVLVLLLGMGLRIERAKEVAQSTWLRLFEQHQDGKLERLEFPGIALAQARFIALDELRRERTEAGRLTVLDERSDTVADYRPSAEHTLLGREELQTALDAVASCSQSAQQVFRLLYEDPSTPHAIAAQKVGLSVQRVRQIICEVRKKVRTALAHEEMNDG